MKTRPLGNSTLQVSVAGLGCNNFGGRIDLEPPQGGAQGADLGVTMFDLRTATATAAAESTSARSGARATSCSPGSAQMTTPAAEGRLAQLHPARGAPEAAPTD
jgi:hypothetical protein